MALKNPNPNHKAYLISSPPRVGNHLLQAIIRAAARPAIKTHEPKLELDDYSQWTLILLNRRDRFAALMSTMIMIHTRQYDRYYSICKDRWAVDYTAPTSLFYMKYWDLRENHVQEHDFSRPYGRVIRMWYEDFANDPGRVYQQLNLTQVRPIKYPERSPYDYREMITNWEECLRWFRRYEKMPENIWAVKYFLRRAGQKS